MRVQNEAKRHRFRHVFPDAQKKRSSPEMIDTIALTSGVQTLSGTGALDAADVSGVVDSRDWTLHLVIARLTAHKEVTVVLEGSTDGFVSDIRLLMVFSSEG